MRVNRIVAHLLLAAAAALTVGCWSVAAGVTGGALLGAGAHAVDDSSQKVVAMPLGQIEAVTRAALAGLDVDVVNVSRTTSEGADTGCRFEACLIGEDVIPVDVILEGLSGGMTKVTVIASRGWAKPEPETAEEILARIVKTADAQSARNKLRRAGP